MSLLAQKAVATETSGGLIDVGTVLRNLGRAALAAGSDVALTDFAKATQIEFPVLVDSELKNHESIGNVLQTVVDIFSAYLLQAFNVVSNVGAIGIISKFSTTDMSTHLATGPALEERDDMDQLNKYRYSLVLESDNVTGSKVNMAVGKELKLRLNLPVSTVEVQKSTTDDNGVTKSSEKSTEKKDYKSIDLTVMVRGNVLPVNSSSLHTLFTFTKKDLSFTERYHEWRAGKIRFFKDLLFMQDIIDEYKKAGIDDNDNVLTRDISKRTKDLAYTAMTGNVKVNKITTIAVMCEATRAKIEKELGIDINNTRQRAKLFDRNNVLMVAVVDRQWNRIQLYTRGFDDYTDVSLKDVDSYSKKGGGNDILEFLKSFNSGFSPNF